MTRRTLTPIFVFVLGMALGSAITRYALPTAHSGDVVSAQTKKPTTILHLFTGPDKQTHAEEIPVNFANGVFNMLPVKGAELHFTAPGNVITWHPAPRRQYVITLAGHSEIEVADGKKFIVGPGSIDWVEDTTGKGHVTSMVGNDDRVALWLPIGDEAPSSAPKQ